MGRNRFADEELTDFVGEAVAVIVQEVVTVCCPSDREVLERVAVFLSLEINSHGPQVVDILLDDFLGQMGRAHRDSLDRSSVHGLSRTSRHNALSKEPFGAVHDDRRVPEQSNKSENDTL